MQTIDEANTKVRSVPDLSLALSHTDKIFKESSKEAPPEALQNVQIIPNCRYTRKWMVLRHKLR